MIEYTTGLTVKKVLADTNTLYKDNPLDVDATVLLRLDNGVRGILRSSQIATGEENALKIAVYGDKGGLKWEQENPNYLYHLTDDQPFVLKLIFLCLDSKATVLRGILSQTNNSCGGIMLYNGFE